MKGKKALGIIETYGLTSAIEAADTATKAANVELIGYELARGSGLATIKVLGDVGSVKAAMNAANASVSKIGKVVAVHVIPRPHDDIDMLMKWENSSAENCNKQKEEEKPNDDNKSEDSSHNDQKEQAVEKEEQDEQTYTCNLCKDPQCPRKKGEPRVNCIHYEEGDI